MTNIPPEALDAAKKIAVFLAPAVLAQAKKYWEKDHGSKVKQGKFQEC